MPGPVQHNHVHHEKLVLLSQLKNKNKQAKKPNNQDAERVTMLPSSHSYVHISARIPISATVGYKATVPVRKQPVY